MLVAEIQELEEVKTLVTKGQQLGVLTFGDVASAVSEVELDESDVEDLYGHLEKNGIELVEDLDPAQKAAAENERSDGKRGGRKRQKALDLEAFGPFACEFCCGDLLAHLPQSLVLTDGLPNGEDLPQDQQSETT